MCHRCCFDGSNSWLRLAVRTVKCWMSLHVNWRLGKATSMSMYGEQRGFYFASRARAKTPAASGAAADVPECFSVHCPYKSVVATPNWIQSERLVCMCCSSELLIVPLDAQKNGFHLLRCSHAILSINRWRCAANNKHRGVIHGWKAKDLQMD